MKMRNLYIWLRFDEAKLIRSSKGISTEKIYCGILLSQFIFVSIRRKISNGEIREIRQYKPARRERLHLGEWGQHRSAKNHKITWQIWKKQLSKVKKQNSWLKSKKCFNIKMKAKLQESSVNPGTATMIMQ